MTIQNKFYSLQQLRTKLCSIRFIIADIGPYDAWRDDKPDLIGQTVSITNNETFYSQHANDPYLTVNLTFLTDCIVYSTLFFQVKLIPLNPTVKMGTVKKQLQLLCLLYSMRTPL